MTQKKVQKSKESKAENQGSHSSDSILVFPLLNTSSVCVWQSLTIVNCCFWACRSEAPVSLNEWHELRVWRTGRAGILQVDNQRPAHGLAEVGT